jgi:predicted PurR-regulated permease PerM
MDELAPPLEPLSERDPCSTQIVPLWDARIQRISVIVLAILATVAAAWVASELWAGLLLGLLTAYAVEPLHRWLLRRFPHRNSAAAALAVVFVAVVVLGLLVLLAVFLVRELIAALDVVQRLAQQSMASGGRPFRIPSVLEALGVTHESIGARIDRLSDHAAEEVSRVLGVVLGSTFTLFASGLIAVATAFYALKDSHPVERRLAQILPLHPRTTRELITEFRLVGRATLIGSVVAGAIQGAFAALGFAIAGVPRAFLLGALTAVASLIPVLGTMIVWVPVGVILIATGHVAAGVFQFVWGALVVTTLVDYVIRPRVVGSESRSHTLLFLIGLIGGVELLGPMGIIAGPIIMALFVAVLRVYRREIVDAESPFK